MELAFNIAKCVAWAPGLESPQDWQDWQRLNRPVGGELNLPSLSAIPAMQRRRFSPFAKISLHCALEATGHEKGDIACVFSSRHGDLHRTKGLIEDVANRVDLSPTKFGLSVHNAVSGLYSIYSGNRAPISAIAAGKSSFMAGLVDSVAKLHANKLDKILYVYSDLVVPDCYLPYVEDEVSMGIGLLIESAADNPSNYLLGSGSLSDSELSSHQPTDFMRFYYGTEQCWTTQVYQQKWQIKRKS